MKQELTPEIICKVVAAEFAISTEELQNRAARRSTRALAEAKQMAAYLLKMHTDIPLRHIAVTLSFDDKQYAAYCIKKLIGNMSNDLDLKIQVCSLELKMLHELSNAA